LSSLREAFWLVVGREKLGTEEVGFEEGEAIDRIGSKLACA
jgi:hypothetical protein